jgi:dolichyl-phosphate-mannose--protein O-mannosyl transferase
MKKLISSAYQLCFKVIGLKSVSYAIAVLYISVANLIFLYGTGILLDSWMPFFAVIRTMFSFPFILGTAAMMVFVTFLFAPRRQDITKESKKIRKKTILIVYSLLAVLILVYSIFIRSVS